MIKILSVLRIWNWGNHDRPTKIIRVVVEITSPRIRNIIFIEWVSNKWIKSINEYGLPKCSLDLVIVLFLNVLCLKINKN